MSKNDKAPDIQLKSNDAAIIWRDKEGGFELHLPELAEDDELPMPVLFFAAMANLPEKHPKLFEQVIDSYINDMEAEEATA